MRRNLDNEISESKRANEAYVSDTVKRFSESYNYYLNQIKLFMDALGQVAVETGQALFSEGLADGDLRTSIGRSMVARLQVDTDPLRSDDNGMVLIGNQKSEDADVKEILESEAIADSRDSVPGEETPVFQERG